MRCKWIHFCLIAIFIFIACISLSSCTHLQTDGPPSFPVNVNNIPDAVPKYEPRSLYGNPSYYEVDGKFYHVLRSANGYNQRGIASWYGRKFNGKLTSSHEPYNMLAMTGASRVLPIPTYVRVTNLENGRSTVVKINDRGPFARNRIIDLSYAAAKKLGYAKKGTALVQVTAIDIEHPETNSSTQFLKNPKLYLQLGAFTEFANAKHLAEKVKVYTNKPIMIRESNYHHSLFYRVLIGPLQGVGESDLLQSKLEKDGLGRAFTVIG